MLPLIAIFIGSFVVGVIGTMILLDWWENWR